MADSGRQLVGFRGEFLAIDWTGVEALHLVDFLCRDLEKAEDAFPRVVLKLSINQEPEKYLLQRDGGDLYRGDDRYELAYALINEIIYQVIADNNSGLALHAAAVAVGNKGVLLPGQSGSGKSTFTAWLVSRGYNYLTDELVVLDTTEKTIEPLTRPVSFKAGSKAVVRGFADLQGESLIEGPAGLMVPHRLFNSRYEPRQPPLSLILFPKYICGAQPELLPLSGALSCGRLIECYVNARNIEDHGIEQLADFVRKNPVYQLAYGSFEGLEKLLAESIPSIFS